MRKNIKPIIIVLLLLLTTSCSCLRWDGKKPKGLISPERADTLKLNYIKNQYKFINEAVISGAAIEGEETVFADKITSKMKSTRLHQTTGDTVYFDTREAWFSFNEIVGYLTMAQKHAYKMGYENLGIRMYLGSYIKDGKPKTTVCMIATYRDPKTSIMYNALLRSSGTVEPIDPNDPEFQKDMENLPYLNYGSSRRPPKN